MQRPLLFLLACSLIAALPLRLPILVDQTPLLLSGSHYAAHPLTQHLDRMPISAELLFTASDDDEMIHVWLPLGKRISTRMSHLPCALELRSDLTPEIRRRLSNPPATSNIGANSQCARVVKQDIRQTQAPASHMHDYG